MEDTTSTTERPNLHFSSFWHIYETSIIDINDSVTIIAPSTFRLVLTGKEQAHEVLISLLNGKQFLSPDGSRLQGIWEKDEVICIDSDPWINPVSSGDGVCSLRELLFEISISLRYLK